jgi:NAD(P)-dependent dehydrogenase (short-subunit alcohol dehydrogenase family)
MTGRSVLITGCASGIGRDAALGLARRGWRVLATCRKAADCAGLRAEGLESFALDHADEASVAEGAAEALARTGGRLDGLVLNGAHALPGAMEDVPRAGMRAIFEANLLGPHDLACRVLPAMRARGAGRVVAISSVLGVVSMPFRGPYCATKYALEAVCDALRQELAGSGVAVSLIEPGPIATRFRLNAVPHFERWIDWRGSALRGRYEDAVLPRLYAPEARPDRFELPPAAVTAKLIRALEDPRPAPRYRVTTPAYLGEAVRRVLPTRLRDRLLAGR